jgi:pimeloyl-ACP methyl ester carboxylesterase
MAAYRLEAVAAAVVGLIDAAGREKASVAGHDWGGVVGWWLASHAPHRRERVVPINAPCGAVVEELVHRLFSAPLDA